MFSPQRKKDVLLKASDYSKPADEQMFGCSTKYLMVSSLRLHDSLKNIYNQMFGCMDVWMFSAQGN